VDDDFDDDFEDEDFPVWESDDGRAPDLNNERFL
jgi:hypothetical protein